MRTVEPHGVSTQDGERDLPSAMRINNGHTGIMTEMLHNVQGPAKAKEKIYYLSY